MGKRVGIITGCGKGIGLATTEKLLSKDENDKKRISKGNRFILCHSIGNAKIEFINDQEILVKAFEYIY